MNGDHTSRHSATQSRRIEFIDLLRGWAVIVMIETHVVNATVTGEIVAGGPFQWLKFLNGLVAPSFLFASGLAYAVTTRRKVNDYLALGTPLLRQLGRILLILAVGYLLHLPNFSLAHMLEGVTETEWLTFFQVDVLQCIAVSLLIMQLLLLVLRSERILYGVVAVLTPLIIFAAPLLWSERVNAALPAPLAAYANGLGHSLFPLFPWSAFLFSGALAGRLYSAMRETADGEQRFLRMLSWLGPGLIAASFLLQPIAQSLYETHDSWRAGPPFVLLRLGIVVILLWGMALYERRAGVGRGSPVTLFGRESFVVYVVHLLLLYGDFGPYNFQKAVNHVYGYGEAAIATVVLILLMYGLASLWSRIKSGSPKFKRAVMIGVPLALLLVFLFGPGE